MMNVVDYSWVLINGKRYIKTMIAYACHSITNEAYVFKKAKIPICLSNLLKQLIAIFTEK